MMIPRTVGWLTVILLVLLSLGHFAPGPQAQADQLPPILVPGQRVISPLGELFIVRAVEGEWIEIAPPQISSGFGGSGGGLAPDSRWLHVLTGSIWRSVR